MTELELNKEYTYPQICKTIGWKQTTGNSRIAQIKEIEDAHEFYHPINKKTHKPKKSYIFTRKYRDVVEPSMENSAGNNRKNIQPMIDYLQMKFDLDDEWYSFTDWYCEKLELMNKGICNAMYHDDEIDAVCEECNITDGNLFKEYVSAAKSELKNMFLKSLAYLEKKNKITYYDEYKFIYQLGKRTLGDVITGFLNERVKEIETTVCNDMNEEYNMSQKMKGRQLLKIIYNSKKYTEYFKELCLFALNEDDKALETLNIELSDQHDIHPDYGTICSERPLIDYRRGIWISDMELFEADAVKLRDLGLEITNRIRTKVRRTLRKFYRKFMKESDLKAIEKALFQFYDEEFDDGFLYLTDDDISDIEQIFGVNDNWGEPNLMEHDFTIEEMLDMSVMSEVQNELTMTNTDCDEESHDNSSHELFCVTDKDLEFVDIDELF